MKRRVSTAYTMILRKLTGDSDQNPYISVFNGLLQTMRDQYGLIGISITSQSQLLPALTLSRMIKKQMPGTHITVGGYLITSRIDTIRRTPTLFEHFFDSAILYEGEVPLLNLIRRLEKGENLDGMPNLLHRVREQMILADTSEPAISIDPPTPDFDGLPLHLYFSPVPTLPVFVARLLLGQMRLLHP